MTNEAKTGYDSAIEQLIVFELAFGGIGAIRLISMIWKAIELSDALNPALKLDNGFDDG